MYRIKTLNNIVEEGLLHLGRGYKYGSDIQSPEGILVRPTAMHDLEPSNKLLAVARADAGVNNVLVDKCSEYDIVVFNTLGANADAARELVIVGLSLASHKIAPALEWTKTLRDKSSGINRLVEKGKGQFVGPETKGKSLGAIGLGAIGILMASTVRNLGIEVYGYDSYLSVDAAWGLPRQVYHARTLDEIFESCDYLTVHVLLTPDTKGLIDVDSVAKTRGEIRILNFARGELVDTASVPDDLKSSKITAYAIDFPSDELIGVENVLAVPHLGASTPESKESCARMVVDELKEFLENNNIRNSVGMPSISMPHTHAIRIYVFHRNVCNTISRFPGVIADVGIDIENMQSRSRSDYVYTTLDVTSEADDATLEPMRQMEGTIYLRVIRWICPESDASRRPTAKMAGARIGIK